MDLKRPEHLERCKICNVALATEDHIAPPLHLCMRSLCANCCNVLHCDTEEAESVQDVSGADDLNSTDVLDVSMSSEDLNFAHVNRRSTGNEDIDVDVDGFDFDDNDIETNLDSMSESVPVSMSEHRSEVLVERLPEVLVERLPEVLVDPMPEVLVERMPEVLPEQMDEGTWLHYSLIESIVHLFEEQFAELRRLWDQLKDFLIENSVSGQQPLFLEIPYSVAMPDIGMRAILIDWPNLLRSLSAERQRDLIVYQQKVEEFLRTAELVNELLNNDYYVYG